MSRKKILLPLTKPHTHRWALALQPRPTAVVCRLRSTEQLREAIAEALKFFATRKARQIIRKTTICCPLLLPRLHHNVLYGPIRGVDRGGDPAENRLAPLSPISTPNAYRSVVNLSRRSAISRTPREDAGTNFAHGAENAPIGVKVLDIFESSAARFRATKESARFSRSLVEFSRLDSDNVCHNSCRP